MPFVVVTFIASEGFTCACYPDGTKALNVALCCSRLLLLLHRTTGTPDVFFSPLPFSLHFTATYATRIHSYQLFTSFFLFILFFHVHTVFLSCTICALYSHVTHSFAYHHQYTSFLKSHSLLLFSFVVLFSFTSTSRLSSFTVLPFSFSIAFPREQRYS